MDQITTTQLVARIRVMSGLRSNQLYTDAQVLDQAQMAFNSLYDLFVSKREHYFAKNYDFTLNGSTNSVALPSDFQTDGSLEYTGLPNRAVTVRRLSSWLERNRFGVDAPNGWARGYFVQGGNLMVFPAGSTGNYRLWYTPQAPQLAFPPTPPATLPDGTVSTLPATFTPWLDYVTVYASFCIRRSRQEETGAFEKQIAELTARIERVLDRRTEEPGQAPMRPLDGDDVMGFSGDIWG